jgi:hypothetical protein
MEYIYGSLIFKIDNVDCDFRTEDNGGYLLQNISSGKHIVHIEHPDFYTFDSTININARVINIKLRPKVADFLPLHIGNTWVYQFKAEYWSPSSEKSSTSGMITVTVDSVSYFYSEYWFYTGRIWKIMQILEDTVVGKVFNGIQIVDTTYTENTKTYYSITESYFHYTGSSNPNSLFSGMMFFDNLSNYPRFQIPDSLGNVENSGYSYDTYDGYKFSKNVGFIEYDHSYSDPNFGNGSDRHYWLVSSNLFQNFVP